VLSEAPFNFLLMPLPTMKRSNPQSPNPNKPVKTPKVTAVPKNPAPHASSSTPGKGGGKGTGKAPGKAQRTPVMPAALVGMDARRPSDGLSICFNFNLPAGCAGASAGGSCPKGLHVCCKPGCYQSHSLQGNH